MKSLREINTKNRAYYFFDEINITNLDPNKIKIDKKFYLSFFKNIIVY